MTAIASPEARALTAPPVRAGTTSTDIRRDAGAAAALFAAAIVSATLTSLSQFYGEDSADLGWAMLYAAAVTLPLALRRRYPITVATVICAAYFLGVSFRVPEMFVGQVSVFLAIYTIGAWVNNRRHAAVSRLLLIAAMFLWLMVTTFITATDPEAHSAFGEAAAGAVMSPYVAYMLMQWLINVAYFGGAYYMGDHAFRAARDRHVLRERSEELERERELTAAQAVALDRVRIARELHDVVAHHVSAMGVQAGAARSVIDRDPESSKQALGAVEDSARSAIDELHHLLETLRTPGGDGDFAAGAPSTLRLSALGTLVEQVSASGTPATLTVVGEPVAVPELVEVNLYRIAQEALTNARRHGGPNVTADVRLRYDPDAIELEISNTGRTPVRAQPGLGQLGMRERATASGGVLEVGPRERGGYLVRVRVPLGEGQRA